MFPNSQHFKNKKGMLDLQNENYDKWQAGQLFIGTCTNQTTSRLVHN
jgi:hypothetical protein